MTIKRANAAEGGDDKPLERALAPEAAARRNAGLLSAAAALLWAVQAYALAALLTEAATPGAGWSFASAIALFLAAAALRAGLGALAIDRIGRAAEVAKQRIRGEIAETAASWAPLDARRPSPGRIAALIGEMVEALGPYLVNYEPAKRRMTVVPLIFWLILSAYSWALGLLLLLAGALVPLAMTVIGRAAKKASDAQLREVSSLSEKLVERLRALTDVRLLGAAQRDATAFDAEADALRERTMRVLSIAFLSSAALEAVSAFGIALTAIYVGLSLLGEWRFGLWGSGPLSLQDGLFLLLLAPSFFQPLREFSAAYHDRASAEAFADTLAETLGAELHRMPGRGAESSTRLSTAGGSTIRLERLQAASFGPIDFEIRPGETIALTGPSGAGKSTLLACLAGLRAPDAGRVMIGAEKLTDETAGAWRKRVAWIGQRPHMAAGSLRANIAFYAPDAAAEQQRMSNALTAASAWPIVERAPRGLNSPVGETAGGVSAGVSGGEARRIGVARLAFADREVVLADEPTADLDADTARAVADGLLALANGRILVVATHDPALIDRLGRRIDLGGSTA